MIHFVQKPQINMKLSLVAVILCGGGILWNVGYSRTYNYIYWFANNLACNSENGESLKFWFDHWVGTKLLNHVFPNLFLTYNNKDGFISDLGYWEDLICNWHFEWHNEPPNEFDMASREISTLFL